MRSASSSARSSSSSSRKSKPLTTELLAPAGGQEALVAAVQSGADAVYMGFGAFNARRSARNFSDEEFRAAVSYCHLRGVKVYLTLNTLVTDRELPALAAEARTASECGVDAILVQDWGVLATLQKIIPDVPLHASTQMSLHTLSGIQEAARLGMTRAKARAGRSAKSARIAPSRSKRSSTARCACATAASARCPPSSGGAAATVVPAPSPAAIITP